MSTFRFVCALKIAARKAIRRTRRASSKGDGRINYNKTALLLRAQRDEHSEEEKLPRNVKELKTNDLGAAFYSELVGAFSLANSSTTRFRVQRLIILNYAITLVTQQWILKESEKKLSFDRFTSEM